MLKPIPEGTQCCHQVHSVLSFRRPTSILPITMADLIPPGNNANVDGHDDAQAQPATLSPTDPIMGLFVE